MPRLNLYTSTQVPEGYQAPRLASVEEAGAPEREAARGIYNTGQQVAQGLMGVYNQQTELARRQQEAQDQVAAIKATTDWERDLATQDIKLRQADDFDYNKHPEKLDVAGRDLASQYAARLTPGAAQKFGINAERQLAEKVVTAKYEANKRLAGDMAVSGYNRNEALVNDIAGTPDEQFRKLKIAEGERQNRMDVDRGWITAEEGNKRDLRLKEGPEIVIARQNMNSTDPQVREQFTLDINDKSKYTNLSEKARENLVEQNVKVQEALARSAEHKFNLNSGNWLKYFRDRSDSNINADSEIRSKKDFMRPEDYIQALNYNNKKFDPNNIEKTPLDIERELHIHYEVQGKRDDQFLEDRAARMATSDYTRWGSKIATMVREDRLEGKSDHQRSRDELKKAGLAQIRGAFAMSGVANFDRLATDIGSQAEAKFITRYEKEPNQDANILASEIVKQYIPAIIDRMTNDTEPYGRILWHKSPEELEADYKRRLGSKNELNSNDVIDQRRLWGRYNQIINYNKTLAPTTPTSGSKPKSQSGGVNTGQPLPGSLGR